MNPPKTRIFIVDDHPMVRERLREVIQKEADLIVCGEAESQAAALELIDKTKPALAIVDLALKDSSGLDLIKSLREHHPKLPVLVLSMLDEKLNAERAIRAGARGYINKVAATQLVIAAIRKILAGETYWSEAVTKRLAELAVARGNKPTAPSLEDLTDRELEIFRLIGQGWTVNQIAEHLHLGVTTIETYRVRIREKFQLKDANELLQCAIRLTHNNPA